MASGSLNGAGVLKHVSQREVEGVGRGSRHWRCVSAARPWWSGRWLSGEGHTCWDSVFGAHREVRCGFICHGREPGDWHILGLSPVSLEESSGSTCVVIERCRVLS